MRLSLAREKNSQRRCVNPMANRVSLMTRGTHFCLGMMAASVLSVVLIVPSTFASKLVKQTPLDATTIPQFVEDLPDFSSLGRVNGEQPYRLRFEEFQQKILPESFYAKLPAPFSAGTMVFG